MPLRLGPRKALLPVVLAALLLSGCNRIRTEAEAGAAPVPSGPSVLLVTIDTLRTDRVGAYGSTLGATPTLDRLAAEGALFQTPVASAPLTLPSHATLLTGLLPPRHGVRHNGIYVLSAEIDRLPARFAERGYDTAAVVGAIVLGRGLGLEQGFAHYDADVSPKRASAGGFLERNAEAVTDAAIAWLAPRERPFFLWVHYYDPHAAYEPPSPYAERFPGDPYTGEVAYVDAQLGRLLGFLRTQGRLEGTLVAVTSDHGDSLGEHGELTHSYTLYDATQHVPWILRGPSVPAGRRVPGVVSGADVAPTVLALADLPSLPGVDGQDRSAWLGPRASDEPLRGPAYAETLATRIDHGWAPLHALRTDEHLYVRAPRPELYDVREDPQQRANLLEGAPDAHAEVVAPLEEGLAVVLAADRGQEAVAVSAETRRQLQALGYALPEAPVAETGLDPKDGLRFVRPFELAKGLYEEGRAEEALQILADLHGEIPQSPQVNDLLAMVHLSLGRPQDALRHAEARVAQDPDWGRNHYLLGLVQVALRRVPEAVASFERALALDPEHPEARLGLMWKVKLGGSVEEAEREVARALALQPQNADLHRAAADTWDRLGEYERARLAYERAVALDPANVQAQLGIAIQVARTGDLDRLDGHLALAGPAAEGIGGRMRLAIALAARGEAQRSEAVLRGILAEEPGFAGARRVLARLLEQTGRGAEAADLREQPAGS